LIHDPKLSIAEYTRGFIDRFRDDVAARLAKFA